MHTMLLEYAMIVNLNTHMHKLKHIYRDSDDTNHTVNAIFILLLLRVDHTHTYNNKDVPRICILWYDKDMKQPYLNVTLCEV